LTPRSGRIRTFPYEERLFVEANRLGGNRGSFKAEAAARDLIVLQRGLTGGRDLIGSSYMDERRRLASYLLFYWPVSYAQTSAMLKMARVSGARSKTGERSSARVLDLGSGPGPCSIAAADYLGAERTVIVACDQSSLALESAGRLAASSGYPLEPIPGWNALKSPLPDGPFDLIVIGHMLNELWADDDDRLDRRHELLESALSRLKPSGALLFLEPALLKTAREAIALRDMLAASGHAILAPCLRAGPCPALVSEGQTCHSDFIWDVPPVVRELSQRTGLGKDLVKTTAFVVGTSAPLYAVDVADSSSSVGRSWADSVGGKSEYRVVSDPMVNKAGRIRYLICGEDGRFPLSGKRGESFPAEKAFFTLKRSDRIVINSPIRRETGLALGPDTVIERR